MIAANAFLLLSQMETSVGNSSGATLWQNTALNVRLPFCSSSCIDSYVGLYIIYSSLRLPQAASGGLHGSPYCQMGLLMSLLGILLRGLCMVCSLDISHRASSKFVLTLVFFFSRRLLFHQGNEYMFELYNLTTYSKPLRAVTLSFRWVLRRVLRYMCLGSDIRLYHSLNIRSFQRYRLLNVAYLDCACLYDFYEYQPFAYHVVI